MPLQVREYILEEAACEFVTYEHEFRRNNIGKILISNRPRYIFSYHIPSPSNLLMNNILFRPRSLGRIATSMLRAALVQGGSCRRLVGHGTRRFRHTARSHCLCRQIHLSHTPWKC
jgi:hypothetical protein